MADISSILNTNNTNKSDSELLVDAYKRTQQSRIDAINSKKNSLESRRTFYNNLNTRLNSLISNLDKFKIDNASQQFHTRAVSSSNNSILTVSANKNAILGVNEIFVERIAKNDILISKQLNLSDSFGESAGQKTIQLQIGGETKNIQVEFDGTETNQQALQKIVNAINNTENVNVRASLVKDTSNTVRLSLNSEQTGTENRISFADSSVFDRLGFITNELNPDSTSRTVISGTGAGFKTSNYEELDAKLDINGIAVTRSSNTINDLLDGLTITLKKSQESGETPVSIATNIDVSQVESLINPLINSYNSIMSFIRDSKSIQRQDPAMSTLYANLRAIGSQAVKGLDEGYPTLLTEIGFKINNDGTLSLSDKTKLENFLKDDPDKVAKLFTSEDGFAAKIDKVITNLTGNNGLIRSRNETLNQQIDATAKRKTELEARIDKQANILRKEYEKSLELFIRAQNQLSIISNYAMYSMNSFTNR